MAPGKEIRSHQNSSSFWGGVYFPNGLRTIWLKKWVFSSQSLDTCTKKGPLVQINPKSHLIFLWETVFPNYVILCYICILSTLTSQGRGQNALQGSPTFLAPGTSFIEDNFFMDGVKEMVSGWFRHITCITLPLIWYVCMGLHSASFGPYLRFHVFLKFKEVSPFIDLCVFLLKGFYFGNYY